MSYSKSSSLGKKGKIAAGSAQFEQTMEAKAYWQNGFPANQFLILKMREDGLFVAACAGFGKVLKVLDKRTQKHYAMKLQPKDS